jgi:hypothetical protein
VQNALGSMLGAVLVRAFQLALITTALGGSLVNALAPPTAGDAMCYHLEIPKRFVQHGAIEFLPFTDNSLFPFLMEMLYTLALLLRGPELATLLHWLVGVLFALAAVELATPMIGRTGGVWAGVVTLLVPGVTNQMTAPLNDLAVALYSTLMVIAWRNWSGTRQRRWLVFASVFGGLGLSVKLVTAAMVVLVVVAVAASEWRRSGFRAMSSAAAIFILCTIVTGGVWYARSWCHLGNPVYPYFNSLFGLPAHTASTLRTSHGPIAVAWFATMRPQEFGGRGVQFGAVFLALLPGLTWLRSGMRSLRPLLLVALGYGLIWYAVRQDLRFLLPIVPMLAIGVMAAVACVRSVHRPAFAVAATCLAGLLTFQALIVVKRARPCVAVALGRETRDAYLARHEPTHEVARFVNEKLPPTTRLVSQDFRGFYFEPDFVREAAFYRRTPYTERGDQLVDYFASLGFTHVLLVESFNPDSAVYEQDFIERLGTAIDDLPLVYAGRFASPNGDRRAYRLFALPPRVATQREPATKRFVGVGN